MSNKITAHFAVALFLLSLSAVPASAYDWSVAAKVTMVQPTFLPNAVDFEINVAGGSCAAQSILTWNARGAAGEEQYKNNEAIFSTLMSAMIANRSVLIYGNNSGCTVDFIWIQ